MGFGLSSKIFQAWLHEDGPDPETTTCSNTDRHLETYLTDDDIVPLSLTINLRNLQPTTMHWSIILMCILPPLAVSANYFPHRSSKRGLVYIPNSNYPEDNEIWNRQGSDLTWYYNYETDPSDTYKNDSSFEFIPMLWGAPSSVNDTTFLEDVTAQKVEGNNITYVMGFNEPDNTADTGGSDISPADAAKYWIKQLEPLRDLGIKLGAPAVTGAETGFTWLSNFTDACDGGCTFDFVPIHWYGSFDGLKSHISDVLTAYPGKKIWVTEFALNDATLNETQTFFQDACQYFDENEYV